MNILNIFTSIFAILGGLISIYLFFVNRRLLIFDADKQLELLEIEKTEILLALDKEEKKRLGEMVQKGIYDSSIRIQYEKEMKEKKDKEYSKIEIRKKYLLKIKKFKWLFSKIDS